MNTRYTLTVIGNTKLVYLAARLAIFSGANRPEIDIIVVALCGPRNDW